MAKFSISRRLIVSVLITQILLTVAVVSLAAYLTRRQLGLSFNAALHGRAMSVAALVRFSEETVPRLVFDPSLVPPPLDREHPDLFRIFASDGRVIASSPDWPSDFAATFQDQWSYRTVHYGKNEFRVIRLNNIPVLDREGPDETASPVTITVMYAASTEEIRERASAVALLTGLGSLILLAISTAVSVWAVRKGLAPLEDLAASASRVTADNWTLGASGEARETQELLPLILAMDAMLLTLQQAFASQREFVTNAAHELKTPIAVLKSTLQLLLQRPRTAEEYRLRLEDALHDLARLEALTHSMLRLARAEQLHTTARLNELPLVDLTTSCELSAERLHLLAESKAVRIEIESKAQLQLHADSEDLELIWNNLIENAIRYSPSAATVSVSISNGDRHARIDVHDNGPGIAETDLANIFDRFHRADASRSRETGGYGLGLAIVRAMVQAYGGTITAESRPGSGTTMSVTLPLDA